MKEKLLRRLRILKRTFNASFQILIDKSGIMILFGKSGQYYKHRI